MSEYTAHWLERQQEALRHLSNDSPVTQVLYGGGAGGGKSRLGCMWQLLRRIQYPRTRGVIGRADITTLKQTTLNTFFECVNEMRLPIQTFTYNDNKNVLKFFNGSEILLKDLFLYPSDPDFNTLGSLEITDYFVDEAAEVTSKAIAILSSRVRYKLSEYGLKPKGLLTCNPAKGWVYNDFYQPWRNDSLPEHRAFVQALPGDNPHLPQSYIVELGRLPEYERKRLLEGNWEYDDDSDGLFNIVNLNRCFRDEVYTGKKYISADIARLGQDRTVIVVWQGMTVIEIHEMRRANLDEQKIKLRELITKHSVNLSDVVADEDGVGGGIVDSVKCRGFLNGSRAKHPDRFTNLKAECYYKLAEVIEAGKLTIQPTAQKELIISELASVKRHRMDGDNKLSVTPKEKIKKNTGKSPDYADAIMMRMFFELNPNYGVYAFV